MSVELKLLLWIGPQKHIEFQIRITFDKLARKGGQKKRTS